MTLTADDTERALVMHPTLFAQIDGASVLAGSETVTIPIGIHVYTDSTMLPNRVEFDAEWRIRTRLEANGILVERD